MCKSYHDNYIIESFKEFLKTVTCEKTKSVFVHLLLLHMYNVMYLDDGFFRESLGDEIFDKLTGLITNQLKVLRKEIISLTDTAKIK